MCGRYTLTRQDDLVDDLEAALDPAAPSNPWWKPRFNISPTQDAPVVTLREGVRTIEMMRWGLVPFWAGRRSDDRGGPAAGPVRPAKKPPLMINARVESVDEKPVFRDALERKRCLVPADGFFEWKRSGKLALPMFIHPEPRHVVAFAGLWARTRTDAGLVHSFTIVTGPANELVRPIHDRMPIVLDRGTWAAWLDPALTREAARALLGVVPVGDWRRDPVSTWVNKPDHDDPRCIEPASQQVLIE
jgi:putative SOS response-associated peptidase YedK